MTKEYLDNYFQTLSKSRRERATSLLEEARVGKDQIDAVFDRLNNALADFTPLTLSRESSGRVTTTTPLVRNLRSLGLKINDLYEVSNLISLIISSHDGVLSSEIASLEKEIRAIEKFVENFGFVFNDNNFYDFPFLEPFSDTSGQDLEVGQLPDRSSASFSTSEIAQVEVDQGVLSLGDGAGGKRVPLNVEFRDGNASANVVEETDIGNLVKQNRRGWKKVVAAATPVDSPLDGTNERGAQVAIDFIPTSKSPASQIKILPFAKVPVDLLSVRIYPTEDESVFTELIDVPVTISSPKSVNFPFQNIHKFRIIIGQPVYERKFSKQDTFNDRYKKAIYDINRLNKERSRLAFAQKITKIQYSIKNKGTSSSRPLSLLRPDRGAMAPYNIVASINANKWRGLSSQPLTAPILSGQGGILGLDRKTGDNTSIQQSRIVENPAPALFGKDMNRNPSSLKYGYVYELGLKYVELNVQQPVFRGVYVSKPLQSRGAIGEISLSVKDENVVDNRSDRDSTVVTSVEYSVTNSPSPKVESDWVPILPVGSSNVVRGERVFVDRNNEAFTRFPADPVSEIQFYKSGRRIRNKDFRLLKNPNGTIKGAVFEQTANIASVDIITCDYSAFGDHTSIDFIELGANPDPVLATASSETGAGEYFLSTGNRNTVKLSHTPIIDFTITNHPIRVELETGELAFNVTDYEQGSEPNFGTAGISFIHSGNDLIFNTPIRSPFRVYYQYVENNVRFRVVLRCNDTVFSSPKVDFVHTKAKTRALNVKVR